MSSDYYLTALQYDPALTQKRLGDGFYEQRLVREQLGQLTGRRFLDGYQSDEEQYRALLDSGIAYAKAYHLQPGMALSPEQMASLTSDLVLLVEKEITLADGSRTRVLVPQLYVRASSVDVTGDGTLISAKNMDLKLSGDFTNSGTLFASGSLQLSAANLHNVGGRISGQDLRLSATNDINNVGGLIDATNTLVLNAKRDVNLITTTTSSRSTGAGFDLSHTNIDQVAAVVVRGKPVSVALPNGAANLNADADPTKLPDGALVIVAGRDVNATGAVISNQSAKGITSVQADRDINLNTVTVGEQSDFVRDANNYTKSGYTQEIGTQLSGNGHIVMNANRDVNARAASVSTEGNVLVKAGRDVNLVAGEKVSELHTSSKEKSGGALNKKVTTHTVDQLDITAQRTEINGKSIFIEAGRDLTSVGAVLQADKDLSVKAGRDQAFYEVVEIHEKREHTDTKRSTLGFTTSHKTVDDYAFDTKSLGSKLLAKDQLTINIGESAAFYGAELSGENVNFMAMNPEAGGHLLLGGSLNSSERSHTETEETGKVWQKQSGHGSTTETLNQTTIKGDVSFDPNLSLYVQVPQSGAGQPAANLAAQLEALSQQEGLGYLQDLKNNPKVNWQEIALANEQWQYNQQGLTPVGAAIIAIAVAVATAGAGTAALGTTSAATAGTTAGTTVASTTLAGVTLGTTTTTLATGVAVTTYTAAGAALNAGVSALAAQAAVSLTNNGGNIGETFKELGSDESLKNILIAMTTAGVGTAVGGQGLSAIATQTALGCAAGEATEQGCEKGAIIAGSLSAAGEAYRYLMGYAANAGPGRNPTEGEDGTFVPNQDEKLGFPKFGQQQTQNQGQNVIGLNKPGLSLSQGSTVSQFLNLIPGVNATAGAHDYIFNASPFLNSYFDFLNVPTMLPAAAFAIPASLNNPNIFWATQINTNVITSNPKFKKGKNK